MAAKGKRQHEAVEKILRGLEANKKRPACISAAKSRLTFLLEGIESYHNVRESPDYLEVDDGFLFVDNISGQKDFEDKLKKLKQEIEAKLVHDDEGNAWPGESSNI